MYHPFGRKGIIYFQEGNESHRDPVGLTGNRYHYYNEIVVSCPPSHAIAVFSRSQHASSVGRFADLCSLLDRSKNANVDGKRDADPPPPTAAGLSFPPVVSRPVPPFLPPPPLGGTAASSRTGGPGPPVWSPDTEDPEHVYMRNLHHCDILTSQLRIDLTSAVDGLTLGSMVGNDLVLAGVLDELYELRVFSTANATKIELTPLHEDSWEFLWWKHTKCSIEDSYVIFG